MIMQHYKRLYKALEGLPYSGDRSDLKEQLVAEHTARQRRQGTL